jgi:hypothetical protein
MLTGLARLFCGFQGHHELLHFAPSRLTLRCALCGHETPGWQIDCRASPSNEVSEAALQGATQFGAINAPM